MLILMRVDERLIHGQVVVAWGAELQPDHYVVIDDDLASSEWEQEIYTLGVPDAATSEFVSVEGARRRFGGWAEDPQRIVLLTRSVAAMAGLARNGNLQGRAVNLGGLHHGPGRSEFLPYIHLSARDIDDLKTLRSGGAVLTAQDVPSTRPKSLDSLLGPA